MVQQRTAAGFWSYVHSDDRYENGRITLLRARLEEAVHFYSGAADFRIFQDRRDIGWGEKWKRVISGVAGPDTAALPHRHALGLLQQPSAERNPGLPGTANRPRSRRPDPAGLLRRPPPDGGCDHTELDPAEREIAALFNAHQREDWRTLRRADETDAAYRDAIERMAGMAVVALKRSRAAAGDGSPATAIPMATVTARATGKNLAKRPLLAKQPRSRRPPPRATRPVPSRCGP